MKPARPPVVRLGGGAEPKPRPLPSWMKKLEGKPIGFMFPWPFLAILLALSVSACAVKTRPRHTPGDVESGQLRVEVTSHPSVAIRPQQVLFVVRLAGTLPDCGALEWLWGDGDRSEWFGCGLAHLYWKQKFLHAYGALTTRVRVLDERYKPIAWGSASTQIGPSEVR